MAETVSKGKKMLGSRHTGWLLSIPTWLALVYVNHGKGAAYMKAHLWLTCFFPLLLLFLILFIRAAHLEYKR